MDINRIFFLLLVFFLSSGTLVFGQKKVKVVGDEQIYTRTKEGEATTKYIGHVILTHRNTKIYADSAIQLNKKNIVEMFGRVKIVDGDSITVTAKKLIYNQKTKVAKLRDEIIFKKLNSVTLYTDFLDYDRTKNLAYYYNGGRLVDSTNTLTSQKGYYQTNTNMASFRKDVVAKNPDYILKSDTLQYNTRTNIVYFEAKTEVTDPEGNVFYYDKGSYNTNQKRSVLSDGTFETLSYDLTGDRIFADDIRQYYRATGNMVMVAKSDDIIISGDIGEHWKASGLTKVYGNALMKKVTGNDTLYLAADTLISIDAEDETKKRLLAYHNVKIFKTDLQGKSDSLAYIMSDSIIHMYTDPVLWNEENQMTADSINLQLANNTIDRLNLSVNSFVVSKDTIDNFNQVKGRKMVAIFNDSKIDKVNVFGNGESLYFAIDEEKNTLMGMNKILCSNMTMNFVANEIDNIVFYINPEADFIPPHELKEADKKLKGFQWMAEERPEKADLLDPERRKKSLEQESEKSKKTPDTVASDTPNQ